MKEKDKLAASICFSIGWAVPTLALWFRGHDLVPSMAVGLIVSPFITLPLALIGGATWGLINGRQR